LPSTLESNATLWQSFLIVQRIPFHVVKVAGDASQAGLANLEPFPVHRSVLSVLFWRGFTDSQPQIKIIIKGPYALSITKGGRLAITS
jgi:hypothetical protein